MAVFSLQRLLVLLGGVTAAAADPVVLSAEAEGEGALSSASGFEGEAAASSASGFQGEGAMSSASGFELDPNLMQQTGAAFASQHNQLMAATDVFGLYRDEPGPGAVSVAGRGLSVEAPPEQATPVRDSGMPEFVPATFITFDGREMPIWKPFRVSNPFRSGPLRWDLDAPSRATESAREEDKPKEQPSVDDTRTDEPARQAARTKKPKTSVKSKSASAEPEQKQAESEPSSAEPEQTPARPETLSDRPEAPAGRHQEAMVPAETVVQPNEKPSRASPPQPLKLPDTHILCLLPESGRHRGAHTKGSHDSRVPALGAAQFGYKHAAQPAIPHTADTQRSRLNSPGKRGTQPRSAATAGSAKDSIASAPNQHPPPFHPHQLGQNFGVFQQTALGDEGAAFDQLWNQFGADNGGPGTADQQVTFEPFPSTSAFASSSPDSLPDPSTFGQRPNKLSSADGTKPGQQEQLGRPTYFAPHPRQYQNPLSSGYYPSSPPVTSNPWGMPMNGFSADPVWSYGARSSPTSISRRTAYPAPWRGSGRGPTGAVGWPWPALATESRGLPRPVPSSGVYLVQRSGQRPVLGGYPLYSQWYRPAVVPLPGGGGGGGGWWTPEGQFVRPATAMATSEESSVDSPPLNVDWPWPAVSMVGGRDTLVVTGLGRSSGAMARAGGEHGWPPVASATAGGTRTGGSFSRASSGGFGLIFEDGMFHTGPMAQRKSPEEYVPPQKRPKKPTETEDAPKTDDADERETGDEAIEGSGDGDE